MFLEVIPLDFRFLLLCVVEFTSETKFLAIEELFSYTFNDGFERMVTHATRFQYVTVCFTVFGVNKQTFYKYSSLGFT